MNIEISKYTGDFAENKDVARKIRQELLIPNLRDNQEVVLDFTDVNSATQSFIHALVREVIKEFGIEILDKIKFKDCNDKLKKIISIVIQYIQDT